MDKKKKNDTSEGGEDMSVALNTPSETSFADFVTQHKEEINKLADSNWKKNSNGKYVITKDDLWRQEHEWDEVAKD